MSKSISPLLRFISRMVRAARLDGGLYREVKADTKAGWQAFLVVVLSSLATGIGIGIAGFFNMAGAWSLLGLFLATAGSIIVWPTWSWCAYLIGTKLFKKRGTTLTLRELLRTTGFAASPGILGIFVFIPAAGSIIWLFALVWCLAAIVVAVKQDLHCGIGRALVVCLAGGSTFVLVIIVLLAVSVLSGHLLNGGPVFVDNFDSRLNAIVRPYRFNLALWELGAASYELQNSIGGTGENIGYAGGAITEYFSAGGERKKALQDTVERIFERQIEEILAEEGIARFPPVNLRLTTLPRLLVISPRNKIESMRETVLVSGLSPREIADIEAQADKLDVSSLVVELGGFGGSYPSLVTNNSRLRFTIDTAVEEWVHQYLVFKPLGFRYLLDILGIRRNYEIATINEAVAGMVSQEIGAIVSSKYYQGYRESGRDTSEFDREMRNIRLAVDDYLGKGEIEAAERFMEQQRQYLAAKGYHIMKLNQAYFAWHGTYANRPGSVSPIGEELRQLRQECGSVKEFLDIVAEFTSVRALHGGK